MKKQMFDLDTILAALPTANTYETQIIGGNQQETKDIFSTDYIQHAPISTNSSFKTKRQYNKKPIEANSNYIEISKDKLAELPRDTYIRYIDNNGITKPGGGKFQAIGQNNIGEPAINLARYDALSKRFFTWSVKLSEISKIYKYIKTKPTEVNSSNSNAPTNAQFNMYPPIANVPFSTTNLHSIQEPKTYTSEEDKIISQLGDKMLFNDSELIKQKVDLLEVEVHRIDEDLKKVFVLVKRIYKKVYQNVDQPSV